MLKEIERKFLIHQSRLQEPEAVEEFEQGYLDHNSASVRIRIRGDQCFLTIKSRQAGLTRMEYEYPIPIADAREMIFSLCGQSVRKKRHYFMLNLVNNGKK